MAALLLPPSPAWQRHAARRGVDPEYFFPGRGESLSKAKATCAICPVRAECLDYALVNGEKHGVWGGLSERERRRARRVAGLTGLRRPANVVYRGSRASAS